MRKIVFTFKEGGEVVADADGFKGSECVKLTDELLKVLDAKIERREIKGEFYAYEKQKTSVSV